MKHKSYQYKLKPTHQQRQTLTQWGSAARWLWNYFLDQNKFKSLILQYLNALLPNIDFDI
jgi:hypothetical protein